MKTLLISFISLFSLSAFASITLDIDLKNNENGQQTHIKQKIRTNFDETYTLKVPKTGEIIEVMLTDRVPEILKSGAENSEEVFVDMKLYKVTNGKRHLVSSPKVITMMGKEATMETYTDESRKHPIMTLKLTPMRD